ncbi:molybdenum cofactor guanylyltransferase [Verrucomicrobiota bacterium]|nr:molybdenum cofactor guanylyltransferase [Verrucomicrobiota bacterium]
MSHAAVLLAGGKSSRMGRDKSALPVNGEPLWQRQLAVLRATEPAELFISGKSDGPYAGCGVEILPDEFSGCGPLGGIATALRRCKSDRLLVLAVDMPAMTAAFLRSLVEDSQRTAKGIIPSVAADGRRRRADSQPAIRNPKSERIESARLLSSATTNIEPLAGIYPRTALAIADECLRAGEFKLETFVRKLESAQLAVILSVTEKETPFFTNWNAPEDLR